MTPGALHMSNTCRWITPVEVIEAARLVMGTIDLDPASEYAANQIVKAEKYYIESQDGLALKNAWSGNVWCNPPGDKRGYLPKKFWERTLMEWRVGNVKQAMFLLFSLNQLQTLQDIESPIDFPFVIFRKRLKFINPDTMQSADQPAQGNALIYLPPKNVGMERMVQMSDWDLKYVLRFENEFNKFGATNRGNHV